MHEFAHILLGETGIDFPDVTISTRNEVEVWCNRFASAFLLPADMAMNLFKSNKSTLTETDTLNKLSRKYKLSKAMLLFNMLKMDFISETEYEDVLERYKPQETEVAEEEEDEDTETKAGGIPADVYPGVWQKIEQLINNDRLLAPKEVLFEIGNIDDKLHSWSKTQNKQSTNDIVHDKTHSCYRGETERISNKNTIRVSRL